MYEAPDKPSVVPQADLEPHLAPPRSSNAHPDKALVEDGYDKIASKYLAWSAPRPTTTRTKYIDLLAASLPKGASVLELGCGAGVPATQQLIRHGLQVTGTDISQAQIDLAREHCPGGAAFIKGDMVALTFPDATFDAICAFYSIFHLPVEEQGHIVTKMKGWLKPGGKMLFNLRTDEGEHRMEDWMGARMFSCAAGIEGNREMMKAQDGIAYEEELAVETVGSHSETFAWYLVTKL